MNRLARSLAFLTFTLSSATLSPALAAPLVPVKVATLTPLSGSNSSMGTGIKNAAQLAVNEMKGQFAQAGFALSLVAYDDQADAVTGTAAARRIVADKAVLGIVGVLNSGVVIPVSASVAPSHLPIVAAGTTNPKVTERGLANINRVISRDDAEGPAGADFIVDQLKAKKAYVLSDKTPYGQGLADETEKALRRRGVTIVQNEGISAEERDFSAIISKIQRLKPDVVYFGAMYGQAGPFVQQLRSKGVNVPFVGGAGFDSDDMIKLAGAGANNIYFTTGAPPLDALPAARKTAASFKAAYNRDMDGFAVLGYDATKVMLQAILNAAKKNGGKLPSRTQVETALRKSSYPGMLTGDITFDSKGDRSTIKLYVISVTNGVRKTAATQSVRLK